MAKQEDRSWELVQIKVDDISNYIARWLLSEF
jgi:hypothetical protein